MSKFEEMAKAAREKNQSIVDAAAEAERARKQAEAQRLEVATDTLHVNVRPILDEAAAAFATDGITMSVEERPGWRLASRSGGEMQEIRAINLKCSAEVNGRQVSGETFSIEHDGSNLSWKRYGSDGLGQRFNGGTIEDFVEPVIGMTLETYYEKLRKSR